MEIEHSFSSYNF